MGGKGKKKSKGKKEAAEAPGGDEEAGENGENGEEGGKAGKKGKEKKGKKGKGGKSSKFQGDIFSEAAMENAYYVCHSVMYLLQVRNANPCLQFDRLVKQFSIELQKLCFLLSTNRQEVLHGLNLKRRRRKERNKKIGKFFVSK